MDTVFWIIGFVALVLFVQHMGLLITWVSLCVQHLSSAQSTVIDSSDITEEEWEFFQPATDELRRLGFEFKGCLASSSLIGSVKEPFHEIIYLDPATKTIASVYGHFYPGAQTPLSVAFFSYLPCGRILYTIDCSKHLVTDYPDHVAILDGQFGDIDQQWQLHKNTLLENTEESQSLLTEINIQTIEKLSSEFYALTFDYLCRTKRALRVSKECAIFNPSYAFDFAKRIVKGQANLVQKPPNNLPLSPGSSVFYLKRQMDFNRTSSTFSKFAILVGSCLLFYVTFGFAFSWSIVPIVLLVLFVHELGHYVAMRVFGYQDPRIFFVPFLGAATTGKKPDAPLWQEVIVYLAGPIPGIIFAGVILLTSLNEQYPWLILFATISLLINLFNLLPILPLDGGRVVERLYFSRFPLAQLVFSVLSVVLFFVCAWWLSSVFIFVLGVIFSFAIPSQWQVVRLLKRFQSMYKTDKSLQAQLLPWLCEHEPDPQKRLNYAKSMTHFLEAPRATTVSIALGTLLYFGITGVSAWAAYQHYSTSWLDDDYYSQEYWVELIENSTDATQKLSTTIAAIRAMNTGDKPNIAQAFYTEAKQLALGIAEPNILLANLRLLKPDFSKSPLQGADIQYVIDNTFNDPNAFTADKSATVLDLVEVSSTLSQEDKVNLLEDVLGLPSDDSEPYTEIEKVYYTLGRLYQNGHDVNAAEKMYKKGFEVELVSDRGIYFDDNFMALVNLYFDQVRYIEAIDISDRRLDAIRSQIAERAEEYKEYEEFSYSDYIQLEQIKPMQIRAWFNHLNGWGTESMQQTEDAIALYQSLNSDNNKYSTSFMTLLSDSVIFAEAHLADASPQTERLLGQPRENLKRFAKQCDCKVRKGLTAHRYEQYTQLLRRFSITAH